MWPELEPAVTAWNEYVERGDACEGALPAEGTEKGFRRIPIDGIRMNDAHYEFLVRGRAAGRGLGGVLGLELHIENGHDRIDLLNDFQYEMLPHRFPRVSAQCWRWGQADAQRLSFLVPSNAEPRLIVERMCELIGDTRARVLDSFRTPKVASVAR